MKAFAIALRDAVEGAHCAPVFEWVRSMVAAGAHALLAPTLVHAVALYCLLRTLRSLLPRALRRAMQTACVCGLSALANQFNRVGCHSLAHVVLGCAQGSDCRWLQFQARVRLALLLLSDFVAGILLFPLLAWCWHALISFSLARGVVMPDLHALLALGIMQELFHSWRHAAAVVGIKVH